MECPPTEMERINIDILVSPTEPPPPPPIVSEIPPKLLAIMRKYKYNWRLEQLSRPRVKTKKFVPIPVGFVPPCKKPPKLNDEKQFYADQMSKPLLRSLYLNKRMYGNMTESLNNNFDKNIEKTWGTIYNYYKRKERERKLRQLRQKQKTKKKKKEVNKEFYDTLAKPKPEFKPEPKKKPSKIFSDFSRLDEMAAPKPTHVDPPKSLEVSPAALTYEPTEQILALAKPLARYLNLPKPLEPGKVRRSALLYKLTPRTEKLAEPKQRSDKSKEDEDFDPWAISKNALKYKATPRILELAKPFERD